MCGKKYLQQEVLVRVEHQPGKNFCLFGVCLTLLPSRRATSDFFAQTISTAVPTVSSNKVEKICLLRLLSGNHRDKTFFFFQPQLSSTPLPAVLAAWRLSWSMDTSKAKRKHIIEESIAHWTFCCRLLYIKLLRQKCSGMLLERWIGETFSKMYVKTCSSVLYSSVAIYIHRSSLNFQIPENLALEGLAGAMVEAWRIYNRPK